MKEVVNGVRYDTDKALYLGEVYHGEPGGLDYWEAGLYVTPRSRRFFLAGEGGPMTAWAMPIPGGGVSGSWGIIPISRQEALELAEEFLDPETVEEFFGDMIEDA